VVLRHRLAVCLRIGAERISRGAGPGWSARCLRGSLARLNELAGLAGPACTAGERTEVTRLTMPGVFRGWGSNCPFACSVCSWRGAVQAALGGYDAASAQVAAPSRFGPVSGGSALETGFRDRGA